MKNILFSNFDFLVPRPKGQAALSLVFLIGGVLILIGVTLSFVVLSFLNSTYGFQAGNRALAVAYGGANDGMVQLIRNKDFSAPGGYSVPLGPYAATVSVSQNVPVSGQVTILSDAVVSAHERKIRVVAVVASSTGEVSVFSWQEITL